MKLLFEEYGSLALSIVCGVIVLSLCLSFLIDRMFLSSTTIIENNINEKPLKNENAPVSIGSFVVNDAYVKQGGTFDYKKRVKAYNTNNEDISSYVTTKNKIDTSKTGETEVTYILRYNGETMLGKAKLFIEKE